MEQKQVIVDPEVFPQQLKELRGGMSQTELAKKSGVSQQTISAIEKGSLSPTLKVLMALAAGLGIALLIGAFMKGGEKDG